MENRRFDALARAFASGHNRRTMLKGLFGLGVAATAGAAMGFGDAEAARRTTPTPTPTPPACPGSQHWDGSACVCSSGNTTCGSACCPDGQSVCCDGACCAGECYGEELCCPSGSSVCHGAACCVPADVCLAGGTCCTPQTCPSEPPASLLDCGSGSNGCGGSIECSCPANWLCIGGASGNFCANLTNQCIAGITASSYGDIGLCSQGAGFCAISTASDATECVSLSQAVCAECAQDEDCEAISGGVCVYSWSEVCSTSTMCAQAL